MDGVTIIPVEKIIVVPEHTSAVSDLNNTSKEGSPDVAEFLVTPLDSAANNEENRKEIDKSKENESSGLNNVSVDTVNENKQIIKAKSVNPLPTAFSACEVEEIHELIQSKDELKPESPKLALESKCLNEIKEASKKEAQAPDERQIPANISDATNNTKELSHQPLSERNKNNNFIKMSDGFDLHLIYPEPIQSKNKNMNKEKLPSAISSAAWRKHFQEKDRVKRQKTEEIERRKRIRMSGKAEKQPEKGVNLKKQNRKGVTSRRKIRKGNRIHEKGDAQNKQRIKCASCEEELVSDTETEDEKNIGCDKCTNWFHMKCTEFCGLPYEEAASKDYICFCCS